MVLAAVYVVDWGIYEGENIHPGTDFKLQKAHVVGFVVKEDSEKVVLAQQVFADGSLREVVVIPKVCILQRADLTNPIPPDAVGALEVVKKP